MIWKRKDSALGFSGVTLVELMVALAIMSILGAVAFSMGPSTIARYNLRAEARELVINFKKAKLEAMKRRRNVVFQFTPAAGADSGSYQVFADNNANGTYEAATDRHLFFQPMRQSVVLANVTFTANRTWYTPQGMVTLAKTGNCELRMSDGSNRYRLVLSTTGAVRMEASNDGGVTWTVK